MKKILLYLTIFVLINTSDAIAADKNNNNNNNIVNSCPELPTEVWYRIILQLLEIGKAQTLDELQSAKKELLNFSLTSKMHAEIIRDLVNRKVNINGKETTLKKYFVEEKNKIKIKQMLQKEIFSNINVINEIKSKGWNPLLFAIYYGKKEIAEGLIVNGTKLDFQDAAGSTALIVALNKGYIETAKLLIENGADLNIQNWLGKTALMVAVYFGYEEIVKLLLQKGAKIDIQDNLGQTALTIAARNNEEIFKLLSSKQ